jgi:hypothetical protein
MAEYRVGEESGDVGEGGAGAAQQGEAAGPQDVVDAGSPVGDPDAVQDADQVVDGQVGVVAFQGVQGGWGGPLVGVQQHQPRQGPLGEPLEEVADEVAFGVDHHHPTAFGDVVEGEVGDQGRLARPGRPQQVDMVAGVRGREPDRPGRAEVGVAQRLAVLRQPGWGGDGAGAGPGQPGHRRVDGEVGQGGQLPHGQQISLVQGPGGQGLGGPPQSPP